MSYLRAQTMPLGGGALTTRLRLARGVRAATVRASSPTPCSSACSSAAHSAGVGAMTKYSSSSRPAGRVSKREGLEGYGVVGELVVSREWQESESTRTGSS